MKRSPQVDDDQSGFTLLEVLVASVVALVGVLGLLSVFPQAYDTAKTSGSVTVLNHLALEAAEHLRSISYDDTDLSSGIHPALQLDSTNAYYYPVSGRAEDYALRWRVLSGPTDSSGTPEPDIKTIVIEATYRVRYTSGGDPIQSAESAAVSFRTFITP